MTKLLQPLAAVADQAWLSLISLAVSIAFIREATKTEYGYYLLLAAPLLLVQGVQNAIVNSPLATILPAANDSEKRHIKTTAISLHAYLALLAAVLGAAGLLLFGWIEDMELSILLILGFSLAIIGTIARESQRSLAYAQGLGIKALTGDLVYGLFLLAGIGLAIAGESLSAGAVLLLTGLAGVAPLTTRVRGLSRPSIHPDVARQFWSCTRWALPSVIATWVSLNSYPYFAGTVLGVSSVADIGAARLFLMPIGLVMTAWGNWYRPRVSRWFSIGDIASVKRVTHTSLAIALGLMAAFAAILSTAYPWLEALLGAEYRNLQSLVLLWLLYFSLAACRNIYMATLMTDALGYKTLHHITWLGLILSLSGLAAVSKNGASWVIGVLCAIELSQAILVALRAHSYWRRSLAPT